MHWVTAVALIGMLVSGLRAADMSDPAAKLALLRIHAVMGVSVLALTLLRLFWWWLADKKPADPAGTPRWQAHLRHRCRISMPIRRARRTASAAHC